ncbi:MAG: hypothetical protein CM15mP106_1270 [Candidatus Neomarinimicrobiota bacterium]|nr:MAG: hypothetical protein CM15mP106_1270 [Candidatus Neomarinimicrobiota bacterium]
MTQALTASDGTVYATVDDALLQVLPQLILRKKCLCFFTSPDSSGNGFPTVDAAFSQGVSSVDITIDNYSAIAEALQL